MISIEIKESFFGYFRDPLNKGKYITVTFYFEGYDDKQLRKERLEILLSDNLLCYLSKIEMLTGDNYKNFQALVRELIEAKFMKSNGKNPPTYRWKFTQGALAVLMLGVIKYYFTDIPKKIEYEIFSDTFCIKKRTLTPEEIKNISAYKNRFSQTNTGRKQVFDAILKKHRINVDEIYNDIKNRKKVK